MRLVEPMVGRGQIRRRHPGSGELGEQLAQQRCQALQAQWREVFAHEITSPTLTTGGGSLVQSLDRAQHGARSRIDKIDVAEVPAGTANMHQAEVVRSDGDRESPATAGPARWSASCVTLCERLSGTAPSTRPHAGASAPLPHLQNLLPPKWVNVFAPLRHESIWDGCPLTTAQPDCGRKPSFPSSAPKVATNADSPRASISTARALSVILRRAGSSSR